MIGAMKEEERAGAESSKESAALRACRQRTTGRGVVLGLLLLAYPGPVLGQTDREIEEMFWRSVECESVRQVELYLESYPEGAYVTEAWACLEGQLGLDRAARKLVQQGLAAVGYDPGPADGLFGGATRAAVRKWQRDNGEKVTGYVTRPQAEGLRARGEEAERETKEERRAQAQEERRTRESAQRDLDRKIGELRQRERQLALNICEDILRSNEPSEGDDKEWEARELEAAKAAFSYTSVMSPHESTQAGQCGHDAWHDMQQRIAQCHEEYYADRGFLRGPARSRFRLAMAARRHCGDRDDEYDRALRECCERYIPLPGQ